VEREREREREKSFLEPVMLGLYVLTATSGCVKDTHDGSLYHINISRGCGSDLVLKGKGLCGAGGTSIEASI
jgi:hypothetical protein